MKPKYKMMYDNSNGRDCAKCCFLNDSCDTVNCSCLDREDNREVYFIKLN